LSTAKFGAGSRHPPLSGAGKERKTLANEVNDCHCNPLSGAGKERKALAVGQCPRHRKRLSRAGKEGSSPSPAAKGMSWKSCRELEKRGEIQPENVSAA